MCVPDSEIPLCQTIEQHSIYLLFYFIWPHGLWDHSSPTRNHQPWNLINQEPGTSALSSESMEFKPLYIGEFWTLYLL